MRALLLAAAAAALSCSHFRSTNDRTLCPESREQVCLTAPACTMDESRGCRVCQCSTGEVPGGRPEDYGRVDAPRDRNQPP
jgi:hypothetical protein